jgi:LysR family hydrogen peroxide-inducible transcriptional activator
MGASSLSTLSRLVAAGFGLTLMPELAVLSEGLGAPDLHMRRFSAPEPARTIGLFRRDSGPAPDWFDDLHRLLAGVGDRLIAETRKTFPISN